MRVHDVTGSKLDGRSKIGWWMGFDEETLAHRIYWAEKRSVTVERSVNFRFEEEVLTERLPLEGEKTDPEEELSKRPPSVSIPIPKESIIVENVVEEAPERPKRNRKELDYVCRLRDGEGTASS